MNRNKTPFRRTGRAAVTWSQSSWRGQPAAIFLDGGGGSAAPQERPLVSSQPPWRSETVGHEHHHDASIGFQSFQETMPEEEQIYADNKRYQYHGKDTRVDSPCHFDHRFQSQCVSRRRKLGTRKKRTGVFGPLSLLRLGLGQPAPHVRHQKWPGKTGQPLR